ncbi:F-box/LRR-repeat protein 15 [Asimina triloba]
MPQVEQPPYSCAAYVMSRAEGLWRSVPGIHHLSLLDLPGCFILQLTDDCLSATTASCPNIESLILMSCPSIGSDGLSSLRRLPNLTYLDLSYTFLTNLQPVFESCLQLKVLKLQACKYLSNSSLDSLYKGGALPALRELDLSYGSISQFAIEELLTCCTHLTHVSLNGCINMHDLDWDATDTSFNVSSSVHCPSEHISMPNECKPIEHRERLLQNLNCVGCQNIKKVVIPPMARCFHLTLLNLSLSNNLKEVDLACFNLSFLNLSNCYSLEVLKLDCPRLTSLSLQYMIGSQHSFCLHSDTYSREAVEAAISQCSMLETLDIRFCPKVRPGFSVSLLLVLIVWRAAVDEFFFFRAIAILIVIYVVVCLRRLLIHEISVLLRLLGS